MLFLRFLDKFVKLLNLLSQKNFKARKDKAIM